MKLQLQSPSHTIIFIKRKAEIEAYTKPENYS